MERLKRAATLALYPELKAFPPGEWQPLLRRARDQSLDTLEWLGILASIALVTWMLRDLMPAADVVAATTLNVMRFFLAIPLLAIFAGPFLLRRTRRALEALRQQREAGAHPATYLKEVSHE